MDKYNVEYVKNTFECRDYIGYIDGKYAGEVTGYVRAEGVFEIQSSLLVEKFRGATTVRAFKEITDAILKDFECIVTKIPNYKNDSLKIALSRGFTIIGTSTYGGVLAVDFIKTREEEGD